MPAWVKDEAIWDKAKKAAAKSYDPSSASFYAAVTAIYKKMGGEVGKSEADGGAGFGQVLRSKESSAEVPASIRFQENTTFLEAITPAANQDPNPSRFSAIIIQEGMGNFRDGFYYTKEALESACALFEGKKIYADHPTTIEEQVIPERSVRDILGHFENCRVIQAPDGHHMLQADLVVLPEGEFDWARGMMKHAINYNKKYPTRDFVGLSINANGHAEERAIKDFVSESKPPPYCMEKLQAAMDGGIDDIRVVSQLTDAISCDLVTEAGAGGRLLQMVEGELMKKKKAKEADQKHPASGKGPKQEAGGEPMHDDAEQDKELIRSMLKKHMGGDSEPSEEDVGMAKECMDMAKEMGYEGEEAEKHAMAHMKMAKKMGEKMAKEAEAKQAEAETESESEAESSEAESSESEAEAESSETKESNRGPGDEDEDHGEERAEPKDLPSALKENLSLRGENAGLKAKLRARELVDYLDKKLEESGEERKVTTIFRESLKMEDIKSKKEIDARWDVFIEAFRAGQREADPNEVVISVPKRGSEGAKGSLDLSDCVGGE